MLNPPCSTDPRHGAPFECGLCFKCWKFLRSSDRDYLKRGTAGPGDMFAVRMHERLRERFGSLKTVRRAR